MTLPPRAQYPQGKVVAYTIESSLLKDSFLGDSPQKTLTLYYPATYTPDKHYPLLVDLAPYTNSGQGRCQWKAFGESLPDRLGRLMATGVLPACIVAFPDSMTRYGGNQFVNSTVVGRWEDHIHEELIPFIEKTAPCGGAGKRACYGMSSGGYGALYFAFKRPGFWSAVACHSGDMAFDITYLPGFPAALNHLASYTKDNDFEASLAAFLKDFEESPAPSSQHLMTLMLVFAMGASYDPDPAAPFGIRLPVDRHTAEVIPDRWERWLRYDPLRLIETHGDALKSLKNLFIDCGNQDQFQHHYGARRFVKKLHDHSIPHVYEEFPGTHFNIAHRLDRSLPFLVNSLL